MSEPHYPRTHSRFSTGTEWRLEEIRQILREAEPLSPPSTQQQLDTEAIDNRHIFKQRFGRDWPLRFHREALVRLRRERDWTDGEVKLFLLSGMLRRGPFGVRPEASGWIAAFGGAIVAMMLTLVVVLCGIFADHITSLSIEQAGRGSAVMLLYLGLAWLAYQILVRPWRIQRRSE